MMYALVAQTFLSVPNEHRQEWLCHRDSNPYNRQTIKNSS